MKTKLFLASILFITLSVRSQNVTGGIIAGASTSAVKIGNTGEKLTDVLQGNNIQGFEAGAFLKLMVGPVYLKPMALYDFSSGKIESKNDQNINNDFVMHRIETPVLLGIRIVKPLSVEAGPVYNYILSSTNAGEDISIAQNNGLGYRAGVALEVKRLLVNMSYTGFAVKARGLNTTTYSEPYKIIFGLGIKLGKIED